MILKTLLMTIGLLQLSIFTFGQNEKVLLTANSTKIALITPLNIQASDGLYPKHIEVKWEGIGSPNYYRYVVYRSESSTAIGELISKADGQKSTWLEDYNVEPGTKYFYRVKAQSIDYRQSNLSDYNSGYTRAVAAIRRPQATTPTLWVHDVELKKDNKMSIGESIDVVYQVENKSKQPMTNSQIRFYLSRDKSFDGEDILLDRTILGNFPAQYKASYRHQLTIPEGTAIGKQYLLIVSVVNDKVLDSKVKIQELWIE